MEHLGPAFINNPKCQAAIAATSQHLRALIQEGQPHLFTLGDFYDLVGKPTWISGHWATYVQCYCRAWHDIGATSLHTGYQPDLCAWLDATQPPGITGYFHYCDSTLTFATDSRTAVLLRLRFV